MKQNVFLITKIMQKEEYEILHTPFIFHMEEEFRKLKKSNYG